MDPRSQFVDARASSVSRTAMWRYARRSRALNRMSDGDQTVVYLRAR
jgi:hypothetical protein